MVCVFNLCKHENKSNFQNFIMCLTAAAVCDTLLFYYPKHERILYDRSGPRPIRITQHREIRIRLNFKVFWEVMH
jgi:hypothetical protein